MTDFNRKFRFRNFKVYSDARKFSTSLKSLSRSTFPKEERFCLLSQLWRAADSVILNIAEGSERGTDKDFAHFLTLALSSLNEVVACLDIASDNGYLPDDSKHAFIETARGIADQITALRRRVVTVPVSTKPYKRGFESNVKR